MVQTINPKNEKLIASYPEQSMDEVLPIIEQMQKDYERWRNFSLEHRAAQMKKLAELLREQIIDLAQIISNEMGKPIKQAKDEIRKCAKCCEHFAREASHYLRAHLITTDMQKSWISYQPLGIVFAIMPWNYPFWQIFRAAIPALMAGNAMVVKPAPITSGCAYAIEKLFREADFPANLLRVLVLDNKTAASLMAESEIIGVTFTGSAAAGKLIAAEAGKNLKKTVLELGGNDPYLILADADLDKAVENTITSRLNNCGQVCIAAKRIIVHQDVYEETIEKLQEMLKSYIMSDPLNEDCKLGPMARDDLRKKLDEQVQKTIKDGAKLLWGGEIPKQKGFYYPPTLLVDVKPGMCAFEEELFGPVLTVIKAESDEEAIQLANQSEYGLAAAVFTLDIKKGEYIANQINSGTCYVNHFVFSDPRLPFGGIKSSGYGRELSLEGMLEFVNIKTIAIQ